MSAALRPQLVVNYAPNLDLRITCVQVEGYGDVAIQSIALKWSAGCGTRQAVLPILPAGCVSIRSRSLYSPTNFKGCSRA